MTIGLPVRPHYGSAISGRERDLIVGYEMAAQEGVLINKEVTGLGGGSDGVITGAAYQMGDSIHSNGLRFSNDAGVVTFTQVGDTHTEGTIAITVRPWALDGVQWIFRSVLGGGEVAYIYFDGVDLYTQFGNAAAFDSGYDGTIGKSFRLVVKWTDEHVWVFVDSVQIDDYASDTTNDIATAYLGAQDGTFTDGLEGELFEFNFRRYLFAFDEILRDYALYKIRAWYEETLRSVWVSSVDNIAGQLENSRWMIQSINGTAFRVVDAPELERLSRTPNVKAIECTGDGQLWIATQHLGLKGADPEAAYGTWEFWLWHAGGSDTRVWIISSTNSDATTTGYLVYVSAGERLYLQRMLAGVATSIIRTVPGYFPVDTWTRITISRRYDGQFWLKVNGVRVAAADIDIGTNPVTHNVYQDGSYLLLGLDNGDRFALPSQRWGEIL